METRRVEQGDTLYENVLAVGEADHVVAVFLLLLHRGSHIGLVFQIERIPEGTISSLSARMPLVLHIMIAKKTHYTSLLRRISLRMQTMCKR